MNQRRQRSSNPKENPCHICGYQEFIWGNSLAGRSGPVYFRPEGGWFKRAEPLYIRKCGWCGNVQFFSNICDG